MRRLALAFVALQLLACDRDLVAPESSEPRFDVSTSDGTPPELTALNFSPTTINTTTGAASVTVDFAVTDDLSGAVAIYASFVSPSGATSQGYGSWFSAATSQAGSFTVVFPQFSEAGIWTLGYLYAADAVGNTRFLLASDVAALGFPTTLVVQNTVPVSIDIKPGQAVNAINPTSKGNTPVAILSSADFDALSQVDRTSLTFGRTGDERSLASCGGVASDVNGDGRGDLVCQFTTRKTGFRLGDTEGILRGRTVDQIPIEGRDVVRILK